MKNADSFKIPSLIFAAAVVAGSGFVFPASAQQEVPYIVDLNTRQVTSLGTLGGAFGFSNAYAINDSGQVAGSSVTALRLFSCFYHRT